MPQGPFTVLSSPVMAMAVGSDSSRAIPSQVLTHPKIMEIAPQLREICAEGEFCLEKHWAEKISCSYCDDSDTEQGRCGSTSQVRSRAHQLVHEARTRLSTFPYTSNYTDLVSMELQALNTALPNLHPRTFAIIGSGPLPMTSLHLLDTLRQRIQKPDPFILTIDHNTDPIASAEKICEALAVDTHIQNLCADATSPIDLTTFDVVYLAALVGDGSAEKMRILEDVVGRMRPGAAVMMRGSHSLRQLLYPVGAQSWSRRAL